MRGDTEVTVHRGSRSVATCAIDARPLRKWIREREGLSRD
jgi:hypothetical protein